MSDDIRINLDAEQDNADWTKRTFDMHPETEFDPKIPGIMMAKDLPPKLAAAREKYLAAQGKKADK